MQLTDENYCRFFNPKSEIDAAKRVRLERVVDGSVDHRRDVPGGFNDPSSAREYFAEVSRVHAQVAFDGPESGPFEAVLI